MSAFELVIDYLGKFNDFILDWFTRLATLLIAVMTGIVLIQVFFRYVLNHSLPWPEEIAKFMMVWMTFLVAPYAYRQGLNVNMELFVSKIPPRLRSILEIFLHILIIILAFYLLREGLGMMKRGIRIRASTVNFKMAYVYVIVPISFGMLMIGASERILRDIKAIIFPEAPTAADPKSLKKPNDT